MVQHVDDADYTGMGQTHSKPSTRKPEPSVVPCIAIVFSIASYSVLLNLMFFLLHERPYGRHSPQAFCMHHVILLTMPKYPVIRPRGICFTASASIGMRFVASAASSHDIPSYPNRSQTRSAVAPSLRYTGLNPMPSGIHRSFQIFVYVPSPRRLIRPNSSAVLPVKIACQVCEAFFFLLAVMK
jgi:hypothetical protein